MELKANERLSIRGFAQIKRFFAKMSMLWEVSSAVSRTRIGKCIRCIVNGGRDPTILRSLHKEWAPDGFRLRVTDTKFLVKCLRESGALEVIVQQFHSVCETLNYGTGAMNSPEGDTRRTSGAGEQLEDTGYFNEYDDPEFYGVPKEFLNRNKAPAPAPAVAMPEAPLPLPPVETEREAAAELTDSAADGTDVPADGNVGAEDIEKPADAQIADPPLEENAAEEAAVGTEQDGDAVENQVPVEAVPEPLLSVEVEAAQDESPQQGSPLPESQSGKLRKSRSQSSLQAPDDSPAVQRDLSQVLLDLCLDLSTDADCAILMCERSLCDGAVTMIEKDFNLNPRDPRIAHTIELMWNVLEPFLEQFKAHNASPDEVRQRLSHFSDQVVDFGRAVEVMQAIILYVMRSGFRMADKELRNEVLIILTMLAQFPCAVGYFLECGLFHLLLTYACVEEAGAESWDGFCQDIGKFRNFATVSDIDLEFKKELWFVLSELLRSNDPEALSIFSSSPLQATLLMYMEHDSYDSHRKTEHAATEGFNLSMSMNASRDDTMLSKSMVDDKKEHKPHKLKPHMLTGGLNSTAAQTKAISKKPFISLLPLSKLRDFQLLAVAFLLHNGPRVLHTFEALSGPERVIALTLHYCQSDVPEHKTFIFYCLMLLQKCLVQSTAVRAFMEQNNLIQSFLYVYHKSEHEETQSQALRLIATLCTEDNRPLQRLFEQLGGINDLVNLLANYVRKRPPLAGTKAGVKLTLKGDAELPDPFENPYGGDISVLVIAVLDCLLKAVVGNAISESHFAEMEGVDVLLELMETSPFVLRLQVFRFLSDILMNQKLTVYVNAWRSPKTLRSAGQILCHCWLDEEARVVGEKRAEGIITDLSHPLGHQEVPSSPGPAETAEPSSPRDSLASSSIGAYYTELANNASNSITVTKLATAILAGRNATQTNLPIDICTQALERDSRVLIASILSSLGIFEMYGVQEDRNTSFLARSKDGQDPNQASSLYEYNGSQELDYSPLASPTSGSPKQVNFDNADDLQQGSHQRGYNEAKAIGAAMATLSPENNVLGLTPTDQQVLSMAKLYSALREGEWWQAVQRSAQEAEVIPIEADLALIEARLQFSCNAAYIVQQEQIALYNEDDRLKKEGEEQFIEQIITKKNQQIKAEWLKKNGTKLVSRAPVKSGKKAAQAALVSN